MQNNLRKLRQDKGLSLRKLSHWTDITPSVLSCLETGDRPFRENHITVLCNYFGVTSDYLLGRDDGPEDGRKFAEELIKEAKDWKEVAEYWREKYMSLFEERMAIKHGADL